VPLARPGSRAVLGLRRGRRPAWSASAAMPCAASLARRSCSRSIARHEPARMLSADRARGMKNGASGQAPSIKRSPALL
jgi:hypothetical protein